MAHRDTAHAAGAATDGIKKALAILRARATPKTMQQIKTVLDGVLADMRIVCIDLTGDEEEPAGRAHTPGPLRSKRARNHNTPTHTSALASARHLEADSNSRDQRASRRQVEVTQDQRRARSAPAPTVRGRRDETTRARQTVITHIIGTVVETGGAKRYKDETMCADEMWKKLTECSAADQALFESRLALKIFLDASARYVDPAHGL